MAAKRQSNERVLSIAEIRGRYGLAEEEFRVLPDGARDRTVGTVVGRQRRAPARKFLPTEQAVMGTARLEAPPEVKTRIMQRVKIPVHPIRWWPLALGALITPVILGVFYLGADEPATMAAPAAGEAAEARSVPPTANPPTVVPAVAKAPRGVAEPRAVKPARAQPARAAARVDEAVPQPSASASAAPRRNDLPEFPDLEDK